MSSPIYTWPDGSTLDVREIAILERPAFGPWVTVLLRNNATPWRFDCGKWADAVHYHAEVAELQAAFATR